MEWALEWLNDEEGKIYFFEGEEEKISFWVYVISEEEAELKLAGSEIVDTIEKTGKMSDEIISKVTECVIKSFRLLWEEGFTETILVEQKGTEFWKILSSTEVVKKSYSEYMMRRVFQPGEIAAHNSNNLSLWEDKEDFVCENKEKGFSCRLLPHEHLEEPGKRFYLYEVEVEETKRNHGIATECLKALFGRLSEQEPVTIVLQVGSYNKPAVHLYEKLGFEVQEELCCYAAEE